MIAKLDAEVGDARKGCDEALSYEQRQHAEAEVSAALLAVEREEAFWVWRAQQQDLPAEHRDNCSPQAILGIGLWTLPAPAPGTSPERAAFNIIGW